MEEEDGGRDNIYSRSVVSEATHLKNHHHYHKNHHGDDNEEDPEEHEHQQQRVISGPQNIIRLVPPSARLHRKDHEIMIEQLQLNQNLQDQRQTWRSCCLRMDRRATIYFSQFFFCLFVTAFSISQLALQNEEKTMYAVLLGLTTGFQLGVFTSSAVIIQQNALPTIAKQ